MTNTTLTLLFGLTVFLLSVIFLTIGRHLNKTCRNRPHQDIADEN